MMKFRRLVDFQRRRLAVRSFWAPARFEYLKEPFGLAANALCEIEMNLQVREHEMERCYCTHYWPSSQFQKTADFLAKDLPQKPKKKVFDLNPIKKSDIEERVRLSVFRRGSTVRPCNEASKPAGILRRETRNLSLLQSNNRLTFQFKALNAGEPKLPVLFIVAGHRAR